MKLIHAKQGDLTDEETLVKQCRAGNNMARKSLYLVYSKRLLAVCYRYCGNVDLAQDLLHDGFIKVFTTIGKFEWRGKGSLELWMKSVVAHVCYDYLLAQKAKNEVELKEDNDAVDEATLEDESMAAQLTERQLLDFVAELPEGYRMVFNLYVFEKKTHKEIAEILGINEHSSTSQLHRAKYILSKKINEFIKHEAKK